MKAEILLKITGRPCETEIIADPGKAPKGKLPYIEDDGKIVAEALLSANILKTNIPSILTPD